MPVRVALYGGSFNPPHVGHAQVVLHLLHAGFDEVWAVPAGVHPFGKELAPFSLRAQMLRLALSDFGPRVRICTVESELPTPTRTIDTVEELVRRHPDHRFTLALGEDQEAELPRWHRIGELRARVPFFFVGRGPWASCDEAVRIPDYSSTELRRRFAGGEVPRAFLHTRVCDFIIKQGLYGVTHETPVPALPRTAIIGLGHVGGSLLTTLCAAGVPPRWCADPDPERLAEARRSGIPAHDDWITGYRSDPGVDFLLFCTPDAWRPEAPAGLWTSAPICLHSGGMHRPQDVFERLALPQENLGILHPARAVASSRTDLSGGLFSVTGSPALLERIAPLLLRLQATALPISPEDRMAFHAVCALVANGSQVLEQTGAEMFLRLGLDPAMTRELLHQLVHESLEAWYRQGQSGFTGPWARGDETIAAAHHDRLMHMAPGAARLYEELKREAGRLRDPDACRVSEARPEPDPSPDPGAQNLQEKP